VVAYDIPPVNEYNDDEEAIKTLKIAISSKTENILNAY